MIWGLPDGPTDVVEAQRGDYGAAEQNFTSFWAQDTISLNKWTINAGLRWDLQDGANPARTLPANPAFPDVLPALDFPGNDAGGLDWSTIAPRVGVTYALGEERSTLLRGSYARFAQALDNDPISSLNPTGFAWAYFTFTDLDGDNMWAADEPIDDEPFYTYGFDVNDPTALSTPNRNEPNLGPQLTDELILGAEHSFLPEFVVGGAFTWRQMTDVRDQRRLISDGGDISRPDTAADYEQVRDLSTTLPDGTPVILPEFNLREGLSNTGGYLLTNGGRERTYMGLGINWTKRLANQWMMRGYVNYAFQDDWSVPSDFLSYGEGLNPQEEKGDCDGCVYAVQSTGSGNKGDVFLQTGWSWNLNGMYQIAPDRPWGFNVAANLFGRQGTPLPYWIRSTGPQDGIPRNISVVGNTDDFRAEDVFATDIRLEKEFAATSGIGFTFSIDGFNIFNENYVLQRERRLNYSRADFLDETLSPRIWRLGVRLNWR